MWVLLSVVGRETGVPAVAGLTQWVDASGEDVEERFRHVAGGFDHFGGGFEVGLGAEDVDHFGRDVDLLRAGAQARNTAGTLFQLLAGAMHAAGADGDAGNGHGVPRWMQ